MFMIHKKALAIAIVVLLSTVPVAVSATPKEGFLKDGGAAVIGYGIGMTFVSYAIEKLELMPTNKWLKKTVWLGIGVSCAWAAHYCLVERAKKGKDDKSWLPKNWNPFAK
jgi:hypothetical protein